MWSDWLFLGWDSPIPPYLLKKALVNFFAIFDVAPIQGQHLFNGGTLTR